MADPVFNTATATASVSIFSESDTRFQCNGGGAWTFPEGTSARGTAELDVDVTAVGKFVVAFYVNTVDATSGSGFGTSQQRIGVYGDPSNPLPNAAGGSSASEWVFKCSDGNKRTNGADTAYGSGIYQAKVVMAWHSDGTTLKIWFGSESGGTITWFDSGDPEAGTGEAWALTIADHSNWSLVVNDGSTSACCDTDALSDEEAGLTLPDGFSYLGAAAGPSTTAIIAKNFSTTEYIPAHFQFTAWESTLATGVLSQYGVKWTVSGGSEHDGIYTGPDLGMVWQTAGTFTVRLDILDDDGASLSNASTTVTVATPTFDSTIYVSAAGSDSNDGLTSGAPKLTLEAAWAALKAAHGAGGHSRILMRRGDTFTTSSRLAAPATGSGTFYFDAYGAGELPIVSPGNIGWTNSAARAFGCKISNSSWDSDSSTGRGCFEFTAASDATRGMDCVIADCVGRHTTGQGRIFSCGGSGTASLTTFGIYESLAYASNMAVQGCTFGDADEYVFFGNARWMAVNGNNFSLNSAYHVMRFDGGSRISIRGNTLENDATNYTVLSMGNYPASGTAHEVTIANNTSRKSTQTHFALCYESATADVQPPGRIVVVNNSFQKHPDVASTGFLAVECYGDDIAVHGNSVLDGDVVRFAGSSNDALEDSSNRILVANNSQSTQFASSMVALNANYPCTPTIKGNAQYGSASPMFLEGSSTAGERARITADKNVSNAAAWAVNVESAGTQNLAAWQTASSQDANSTAADPSFADPANDDWSIGVDSPCYDAGENIGASWLTREGTERSGTWDIGAFEIPAASPTSENMSGYLNLANIRVRAGQTLAMAFTGTGNAKGRYILTVELE